MGRRSLYDDGLLFPPIPRDSLPPRDAAAFRMIHAIDDFDLIDLGKRYWLPVYKPREVVLDHGKGARVWDTQGRDYIDFGAGIAVNALGHQDPDLARGTDRPGAQALARQQRVLYRAAVAAGRGTGEGIAASPSACSCAIPAPRPTRRRSSSCANGPRRRDVRRKRRVIITFTGSFHGRTLATVTATAQPKYQEGYEPLPGGFRYLRFNDVAALEALRAGRRGRGHARAGAGRGRCACRPQLGFLEQCASFAISTTRCWCLTKSSAAWVAPEPCSRMRRTTSRRIS